MLELTNEQIGAWVGSFMLPLFRITALLMFMPIIGTQLVSARVRLYLALAICVLIMPTLPPVPAIDAINLQAMDDLDAMDLAALKNRPELREEDYRRKISVLEARRALLSILPGIDLNLSSNHDSNKFLYHNSWTEATGTISFNLMPDRSCWRTVRSTSKTPDTRPSSGSLSCTRRYPSADAPPWPRTFLCAR